MPITYVLLVKKKYLRNNDCTTLSIIPVFVVGYSLWRPTKVCQEKVRVYINCY